MYSVLSLGCVCHTNLDCISFHCLESAAHFAIYALRTGAGTVVIRGFQSTRRFLSELSVASQTKLKRQYFNRFVFSKATAQLQSTQIENFQNEKEQSTKQKSLLFVKQQL